MKNKLFLFLTLAIFAVSTFAQTMPQDADPKLWARALKIHKEAIIVDGHNDIPSPMTDEDFDLATDSIGKFHKDGDPFHTDLNRFVKSGITGEFFSIYVSGDTLKTGGAARRAMDLIDATYREVEKHPNQLLSCTTTEDIRRAKKAHKVCALMGIEGGYAIENSLSALRDFYRLGIRYMTLTHNVSHDWADAHRDTPKNNGLSEFGKEVVREMNRLGMLVDMNPVKLEVNVPERFLSLVKLGQSIELRVAAFAGQKFKGDVYFIAPQVDTATRTALVKARIPNPDFALKPGMFANLDLTLQLRADAVVVPEPAIMVNADRAMLYVVDKDMNAQLRPVKLGVRSAGVVEILEGVVAGQLVIVEGVQKVRPGSKVKPAGPEAAAAYAPKKSAESPASN